MATFNGGSKTKADKLANPDVSVCNRKCLEMAKILISGGAQIDAADSQGYTPLCHAASSGNVEMVKLLSLHGANVNHKTDRGHSPLFLAASSLKRQTVFALREFKAEITFYDLMHIMCKQNAMELLRDSGENFSARDISGRTLLHWAAWEGKTDVVAWLLSVPGVDIDVLDEDNWTPLHFAVRDGHMSVAKLLIDKGACPNIRDRWGDSPLSVAQYWKHKTLCQTLLPDGGNST